MLLFNTDLPSLVKLNIADSAFYKTTILCFSSKVTLLE